MTFLDLLNTSISASWLVLVVIGLRFLLKKAPKSIHCALWALVAIRLLCPVTIESPVSLVPSTQTVSDYYQTQAAAMNSTPAVLDVVENPIYPEDVDIPLDLPARRMEWSIFEWHFIWPAGVAVMAGYALLSWLRIHKRVSASIPIAKNIRICDYIDSPFILGVLRPVIYLPSDLEQGTLDHVLAHEMAHLARRDHWWKPLGFVLLTVHWFNPVMWLANILLCRDIELACDEKVIKDLGAEQKKAYSAALLRCSVSRPMIAACPLAFGEVGVKERVKTVLNYKKPAFWIVVLSVIVCAVVAVCFLTDPIDPTVDEIVSGNNYAILAQCDETLELTIPMEQLPEDVFTHDGCEFEEGAVIVHRSETSTISLRSARYADETGTRTSLTFTIRYELPKVGTILLPYRLDDGTKTDYVTAHSPVTTDNLSVWDGEPKLREVDDGFTLDIITQDLRNAEEFVTFPVTMNQLTYAKKGMEPELTKGVYSSAVSQDKSFHASGSEVYRVGWDPSQREVFLDPYAAFEQLTRDYSEAISWIRQANDLAPLTPLNYEDYLRLGWRTSLSSETVTAGCEAVSDFLAIYEHSFVPVSEAENAHTGTYKAGTLLAQDAALSSCFGSGNFIFYVGDGRLSVYDQAGSEVFTSTRIVKSNPTREDVFSSMQDTMVIWNDDSSGFAPSEMTEDFIPAGVEIELWQFYTDGRAESPEYTLFFFDGELTWFARNSYYSYLRIFEVTTPMPEDEKLASGTYISQEKLFWAWYSSLYVEGMSMEVKDDAVTLDFVGVSLEGAGSTYQLEHDWQSECPISEQHRELLAELSDLEPIFAMADLSDCRYLVIDSSLFIVEKEGELYLVSWRKSNIHLEIIEYVFHMVPEAESVTIPLGTVTLETDPVEEAIYRYFLEQDPTEPTENTHTSVSFQNYGTAYHNASYPRSVTHYLNVRIAHYTRDENGTITESTAETFPVILSMNDNGDGTIEILDCVRDDADYSESAFLLEVECWRQAYSHFQPELQTEISALREKYPAYFQKDTANGLDLVWWNTPDGVRCVILSGLQRARTSADAKIHTPLTVPEAIAILYHYDIPVQAMQTNSTSTLGIYHVDAP